jgi:hypothetical protein
LRVREKKTFALSVPEGTASLRAEIGGLAPDADVTMSLYFSIEGKFYLRESLRGPSVQLRSVIEKPEAGEWRVVLDTYAAGPGGTPYTYRDVLVHDAFGRAAPAQPFALASGSSTAVPHQAERVAQPAAPRRWAQVVTFSADAGLADDKAAASSRRVVFEHVVETPER